MDNLPMETDYFSSLFDTYREPFILFANSYVKDMNAAEDIYMEVMATFWEKHKHLAPGVNIPAYLLTMIKNKSLNYLRHIQIQLETEAKIHTHHSHELNLRISSLESCNPSELFADEVRLIIQETFQKLPEQTRRIFYLSRIKNKKNKEIADSLHISIKTVEFHITKSLKYFALKLKDYLVLAIFLLSRFF